jgi:hypothetical protein
MRQLMLARQQLALVRQLALAGQRLAGHPYQGWVRDLLRRLAR